MKTNIIDAKCPYCKTEFTTSTFGSNWAQVLWGQYPSDNTDHICPKCGKKSNVSLVCTYHYYAKKIKGDNNVRFI
jgi:endogenous inhibitor of DNA gyrase (YacG/DUF329 family)